MEINLEFLNKRMAEIMSEEDKLMAQLNYLSGAKNECQYLINTLKERNTDESPKVYEDSELPES